MSKSILFIDPVCPSPTLIGDLGVGRMGGTEATLLRVARGLSARYKVTIAQRGRENVLVDEHNVTYIPLDAYGTEYAVVVTLRDGRAFRQAKDKIPSAKHYLWLHDIITGDYKTHLETTLQDHFTDIIAVSHWYKNHIMNALSTETLKGNLRVTVIHNPVAEYARRTGSGTHDPYKLMFISSPHKGLEQTLIYFEELRKRNNQFKLLIGNPGYYPDQKDLPEGVSHIKLDHQDLLKELSTALCLFYPQIVFPETFGIVYAEANAVGTPVIAHNIGAAAEVLENNSQLVNCNKIDNVIDTVLKWSKGERPTVSGNKLFSLEEVIRTWNKLIMFGGV